MKPRQFFALVARLREAQKQSQQTGEKSWQDEAELLESIIDDEIDRVKTILHKNLDELVRMMSDEE